MLGRLASLIKKFVKRISISHGLSESAAEAAGGKIFTFGSYRLGVHGPGSDIDTLCVVPKHVSREEFFEALEPMLRELEGVTEVSVRFYLCGLPQVLIRFVNVGSARCIRSCHRSQDIRDTDRFDHGTASSIIDTGRLDIGRR